jgi:hypothetical protein
MQHEKLSIYYDIGSPLTTPHSYLNGVKSLAIMQSFQQEIRQNDVRQICKCQ